MKAPSRPPPAPDDALLELFISDARSNAATLLRALGELARGGDAETLLAELDMAAQSIKGAASIIGFEAARTIAEQLQAALRRVAENDGAPSTRAMAPLQRAAEALAAIADVPCDQLFTSRAAAKEVVGEIVNGLIAAPARHTNDARRADDARANGQGGANDWHTGSNGLPSAANDQQPASSRPPAARSSRPPHSSVPPVDAAILALFCTETEACAAALNRGLVQLEAGATAEIEDLMRAAHSIKGAARIVGMSVVSRLAHAMEDCFVAAQEQRLRLQQRHIDVLLEAVDLLSDIAKTSAGGLGRWQAEKGPRAADLAERLQRAAGGEAIVESGPTPLVLSSAPAASVPSAGSEQASQRAVAAGKGAAAADVRDRVVRVAAQSINRLMGLAGESLVESRRVQTLGSSMQRLKRKQSDLADVLEALARRADAELDPQTAAIVVDAKARALECRALLVDQIEGLESYARRVDDLSDRLYREALKSRMRPFGDCVHGLPRMVRDLGRQLGKSVRLVISGEATDVDRDVLESLEAPLTHLLRNAVDHGIEPERERTDAGKPALGTIRLEARHHAGMLAITVVDDGRGIDLERVRRKVIDRGLLSAPVAAELNPHELFEFIFLPGFSTAADVTEVSGRGVGLDAVRSAVESASGTVRVTSDPEHGTSFFLQLPVTRSVMRAVVAEIAGEAYAFPLLRIERVLRLAAAEVKTVGNVQYFVLGDANISLICAQQILGLGLPPNTEDELCVVVVGDRTHRYGVTVDKFLGEHDLVVRPLDPRLGKVQDIAAAAILMNGAPALIFDVDDVVRSIQKLAQAGRVDRLSARGAGAEPKTQKRILVVDDSITVREAERQLLSNHGYAVDVAIDGVDGWNSLGNAHYDLVISDIDMPRMNGLELVRTIKQDPKFGNIPIVIVSYKDREEDRMRGLDAGANYYLTKSSFHDESLVQAVEELIGAASS